MKNIWSLLSALLFTPSAFSQDQLDTTLRALAQFSHKVPLLPDEAFSRESLYGDQD
ncbi:MAG: hypothetical protein WCD04_01225 [Terriglobia bacterium]|jgi:hypothetical protein